MQSFLTTSLAFQRVPSRAGFSLVEVLVALSIFAIVVTMSVGTMVTMIGANNKARDTQSVVSNVAFALDSMTREIRTGYNYVCKSSGSLFFDTNQATPVDCPNGSSRFAFTEAGTSLTAGAGSNRIGYRHQGSAIERKLGSTGDWEVITAPNIIISELTFTTNYSGNYYDAGDDYSPLVTIIIKGHSQNNPASSNFTLQTTITQHELDI